MIEWCQRNVVCSSSAIDIMLSKERFRIVLLLLGVVLCIGITAVLLAGISSITGILFFVWLSIAIFATVIISKFASPRRGRYAVSCFGFGSAIITLIVNFQRWYSCNWNFLVCGQEIIAGDTAQTMAAFESIYSFCAQMMIYLAGTYTLSFKQHLTWNTIFLLIAHLNLFLLITRRSGNFLNLLYLFGSLALVSATELLNRSGRNKAQAKVLEDYTSRTKLWSDKIKEQNFNEQIKRLKETISGGSLAAVDEPLDPKTKKLVPNTVQQAHADIDKLYRDCAVLNYFFQDWVRTWFRSDTSSNEFEFCNPEAHYKDAFKIGVADCLPEVIRGPIKAPNRVISKVAFASPFPNASPRESMGWSFESCLALPRQSDGSHQVYRSYRGRVDYVTDVIRCAIVFASVDELVRFMEVRICFSYREFLKLLCIYSSTGACI
jgi:hypothetical protein